MEIIPIRVYRSSATVTSLTRLPLAGLRALGTEVIFALTSTVKTVGVLALVPVRVIIIRGSGVVVILVASVVCTAEECFIDGLVRGT